VYCLKFELSLHNNYWHYHRSHDLIMAKCDQLLKAPVCKIHNTDLYGSLHLSCSFLQVGTEFLRGVSGGERKRTNIGMELIIEPQVLFLDEPTTGLDAYTAVSVVKLLKR